MMRGLVLGGLLGVLATGAHAQSALPRMVDVFLDCQTRGCDTGHFRNEIQFVNWVRERTVADVHLLITAQQAGGGGTAYQLAFIGLRSFAGDSSTMQVDVTQQMTDSERRDVLTNRIAQGLLRYAARTQAADRIRVVFEEDGEDDEPRAQRAPGVRDPWNFWVFSTRLNGSIDGEKREGVREVELTLDASRVTEAWKFEFEVEGTYEEERFELRDRTVTSVVKDYVLDGAIVKALAPLWSAGFALELGRSTFRNQDFYTRAATLLEYSFFPYDQFSRRQLTLQYSLGTRHFNYAELTIYDRLSEQRYDQRLELSLDYRQPWGSAETSLSGSHYLHDVNRYNLSVDAGVDVRLFRGFSLNLSGSYSRVHDQLYIAKGDADDEEVLLRRTALETNYRYSTSFGIRYTFGSVYNNVVNPRLDTNEGFDRR